MIAKELIMEGVLSIQSGENPKYIREKLNSYVTYQERSTMAGAEGEEKSKKRSKRKKKEREANA
jgi:chemotaxis protein MotA